MLTTVCKQAAKTKALDVINSLGLSDSLLRVIERRQRMDKYITYGGMVRFLWQDVQTIHLLVSYLRCMQLTFSICR